jgi:hypothetical protein
MSIESLFYSFTQVPLYILPIGEWFSIDYTIHSYSDIMQKTVECEGDNEIYVGHNHTYVLSPKSLITIIQPNEGSN